jgi:adenosine deaminase
MSHTAHLAAAPRAFASLALFRSGPRSGPRALRSAPLALASLAISSLALAATAGCTTGDDVDDVSYREALVDDHMEALRADKDRLGLFLRKMPKGGDLHSHTSGAITMEKLLQWGAEDGACVNPSTLVASAPTSGACAPDSVSLTTAPPGSPFYLQVLGGWSMQGFTGPLLDAHQHFFDAFAKYGAIQQASRSDDIYADILSKAGRQHQIYVELMQGFGAGTGGNLATAVFQPGDAWDRDTLLRRREQILAAPSLMPALRAQADNLATALAGARTLLRCDSSTPDPGCEVELRLQVSANRTATHVSVFGQWVWAYELAQLVPQITGVNLVSPEEHPNSLRYYNEEMFALGVLDDLNDNTPGRKRVHVSLHAGELIPQVVPNPIDLTFHIRRAVELAHAERIGHGVDILGETDGAGPADLLADLRAAGVMIEICLTSNRVLLGAAGEAHPLNRYREEGVAVALATDDQGILRNDITEEYRLAVADHGLGYRDLKAMVRASLEHSFLEGESLWRASTEPSAFDPYGPALLTDACAGQRLGAPAPSSECRTYLTANPRAALQWKLEAQLAAFEDAIWLP